MWDTASGRELRTLSGHAFCVRECAVSPDGSWIVSVSDDNTLRIWDAASGKELVTVPLIGVLQCVALHPWQPLIVCGDGGGSLYILELVGIKYGPIIVTATRREQGPVVRCPSCQQCMPITEIQLGNELTCQTEGCGLKLKINSFTIHSIGGQT
jgi:hypothetical protein